MKQMKRTRKIEMWTCSSIIIFIACLLLVIPSSYSQDTNENKEQLNDSSNKVGKVVVCIGKFENKTNAPDELFQRLRTRITNEIVNTRKFEVVEREQWENVISEMELSQRGMISGDNVAKPEDFISAGYAIYGTVLSLGYDHASGTVGNVTAHKKMALIEIQLRFSDLRNNKIVASKEVIAKATNSDVSTSGQYSADSTIDPLLEEAMRKASLMITNELMELAFPIRIISIRDDCVYLNIPKERAKIYDVYNVYSVGEELIDPDTGESLGKEEKYVGKVKIVDIKPKYSVAIPEKDTKIEQLEKGMIIRPINQEKAKIDNIRKEEQKRKEFEQKF